MKIRDYHVTLSGGGEILPRTPEGSELVGSSSRKLFCPNHVFRNRIALDDTEQGSLLSVDIAMELQVFTETMSLAERNAVEIELDPCEPVCGSIVAYYYFKDWWMRPAFLPSWEEIPDETAILFYRTEEAPEASDGGTAGNAEPGAAGNTAGQYHFLLALPGRIFRAHFEGGTGDGSMSHSSASHDCAGPRLVLSADAAGYIECRETAMLAVSDPDPYRCMEKGMQYAAKLYNIPLREERMYPALLNKLGWCSWDAFYKEVNEDGIVAKAEEIRDKRIPFGWMIIDDGWQDYNEHDRLMSYGSNPVKFPEDLSGAAQKVRKICGIEEIGVWHAFSGYWGGIDPDGPLAKEHPELFISTRQGKLLIKPDPAAAYSFYGEWYKWLRSQGIRFVKVDVQSATRQHYRGNEPTGLTAAALHEGLDRAVSDYLGGGLINCMGHAMEDVLQRPTSGVSRNSDDFFPQVEESFKEHLLENSFNTLWHNVLYYGDWDMFWSSHPYARKHALLRALSGGPVYVSDRIGDTVPEVLTPLCYTDGTILRAEKGAAPTEDCLLADPAARGYLKIQNTCGAVGYLAVYSWSESPQTVPVRLTDFSWLMWDRGRFCVPQYAIYDPLTGEGFTAAAGSSRAGTDGAGVGETEGAGENAGTEWLCRLEGSEYTYYEAAPIINEIAVFGRADKYLSSHAIISREETQDGCVVRFREMGPILIYAAAEPTACVTGNGTGDGSNGTGDGSVSHRTAAREITGAPAEVPPAAAVTPLAAAGFYRIDLPVRAESAAIRIRIR